MVELSNFILNSDFPGVGNDARGQVSVTLANGTVIASGSSEAIVTGTAATLGSRNAQPRAEMSRNGTDWYATEHIKASFTFTGSVTGAGQTGYAEVYLKRLTATTVALVVSCETSGETRTVTAGFTVTANVWTMVSPFES